MVYYLILFEGKITALENNMVFLVWQDCQKLLALHYFRLKMYSSFKKNVFYIVQLRNLTFNCLPMVEFYMNL